MAMMVANRTLKINVSFLRTFRVRDLCGTARVAKLVSQAIGAVILHP